MLTGSCHCGKVRFEVDAKIEGAFDCNCSICQRKGSILMVVPDSKFTLRTGGDNLTHYKFNKNVIDHTFCKTCGVTCFASAKMPDGTPSKAINLRCIEGVDLKNIPLQHFDGKSI